MKTLVLMICLFKGPDAVEPEQCVVTGTDTPDCERELRINTVAAEAEGLRVVKAICGDSMVLDFDEELPDEHISGTGPGST